MPAAQPTVSPDLLILAFVAGFALAALIFWPMLRRAQQHATARPGKQAPRPALAGTDNQKPATKAAEPTPPARDTETTDELPAAVDLGEMPRMPTGLFEQNHAEQFERTRARLQRLRTQLKDW